MRQLIYGTVGNAVLLLAAVAPIASSQEKPAADEAAKIRFPSQLPPTPPVPPPPTPNAVDVLVADQLYVIDSDVELVAIPVPGGVVKVSAPETGPIKMRGKFVDGNGSVETRTFNGKFVYTVDYVADGQVTLMAFPVGLRSPADIIYRQIKTLKAPQPPPTPPTPDPEPEPEPEGPWTLKWAKPVPLPGGGIRVLILYDGDNPESLTAAQRAVVFGSETRALLDAACAKGPDGRTPDYRIYRSDVNATAENRIWRDALARKDRTSPNWMVISNGSRYVNGPLATDPAHFAALLDKVKKAKQ